MLAPGSSDVSDLQRSRVQDTSYLNFPYKVRDSVERDLEIKTSLLLINNKLCMQLFFSESLNRKQADLILARNCSVVVLALTGVHFQMPLDQLQKS